MLNDATREATTSAAASVLATFATAPSVHPTITWAKLRAMADAARLASARLWSSAAG